MRVLPNYINDDARYPFEETSQWAVSWWNIPSMADYSNAFVVYSFFDTEEEAAAFVKEVGEAPPEMADMQSVESLLKWIDSRYELDVEFGAYDYVENV